MEKQKKPEGWGLLSNARKWHYFVESRSLCGKWLCFGISGLEQGNDNSPDNCTACKRALKKRAEKKKLEELKKKGNIQF